MSNDETSFEPIHQPGGAYFAGAMTIALLLMFGGVMSFLYRAF